MQSIIQKKIVERVQRVGEELHVPKPEQLREGEGIVNAPSLASAEEGIRGRIKGAAGSLVEAVSDTSSEKKQVLRFKKQVLAEVKKAQPQRQDSPGKREERKERAQQEVREVRKVQEKQEKQEKQEERKERNEIKEGKKREEVREEEKREKSSGVRSPVCCVSVVSALKLLKDLFEEAKEPVHGAGPFEGLIGDDNSAL